jgi:hypothetical protein
MGLRGCGVCETRGIVGETAVQVPADWMDEVAEYLDQRADVDEDQPNQCMSLFTRMQEFYAWPQNPHAEHPSGDYCALEQWPCLAEQARDVVLAKAGK